MRVYKKSYPQSLGFTIVELLIVIVVIGILAAITIVAYNGVTARANNSERVADLNGIAKAIEMYNVDNGRYPPVPTGPGAPTGCLSTPGWNCWGAGGSTNRLISTTYYSSAIPQDPQFSDNNACSTPNNNLTRAYWYGTNVTGTGYILGAYLPGLATSDPHYVTQIYRQCGSYINYMISGGVSI